MSETLVRPDPDPTASPESRSLEGARGNDRSVLLAGGLGGLGFVAVVVAENVLRGASPQVGAPVAEVLTYYREQRVMAAVSSAGFVLAVPCLLLFAQALRRVLVRNPVAGAGVGGLHAMVATFGLVIATDVALNTIIASGTADPTAATVVWSLHGAAFVLNSAVLGSALLLLASGAGRGNALPRWLRPLGIVGGALLLAGSVAVVPAAEGSPIALAGLAGFLLWLVWATAASVSLLRNR